MTSLRSIATRLPPSAWRRSSRRCPSTGGRTPHRSGPVRRGRGKAVVGAGHLLDHVDAMEDGRLDGRAIPGSSTSPAVTTSDARGGIAQPASTRASPACEAAHHHGLAAFGQRGSFKCGPLGWVNERLADAGLVAVATAVAPAVLAAGPGAGRIFGTNPMAYSVPARDARRSPSTRPRAAAFVSVRDAAARGTPLPEGWAVDADGRPTTDPRPPWPVHCALRRLQGREHRPAPRAALLDDRRHLVDGRAAVGLGFAVPSVGMFVLAIDYRPSNTARRGRVPARVEATSNA